MHGDTSLQLRDITTHDGLCVAAIHTAAWRHAYRGMVSDAYLDGDLEADRHSAWAAILTAPDFGPGWLAILDGVPVGFLDLRRDADARWGTSVEHLHVLPAYHGRGVGRRLLEHAGQWCAAHRPADGIFLWVYRENTQARGFYALMGGREVENGLRTAGDGTLVPSVRVVWDAATGFHADGA